MDPFIGEGRRPQSLAESEKEMLRYGLNLPFSVNSERLRYATNRSNTGREMEGIRDFFNLFAFHLCH